MKNKLYIIYMLLMVHYCCMAEPIPINSIEDLQKIGNDVSYPLDGIYYLTQDIDASATRNWNGGKGFEPIGHGDNGFIGQLDGKGFKIKNLYINRPEEWYVGLFDFTATSNAKIVNLGLEDVDITGDVYVGALTAINGAVIENCYSTGKIYGKGDDVGGLVGWNSKIVRNCNSSAKVTGEGSNIGGLIGNNIALIEKCFATGEIYGNWHVGGFIGYNQNQMIACYSTGKVTGNNFVASLAGANSHYIYDSYATGNVEGTNYVWGLIAYVLILPYGSYEVRNSFYDYETTGQYNSNTKNHGYPKSTVEMMTQATFTNWDFDNVWWMLPGKSYPVLRPVKYVGVSIKSAGWMTNPKYGLPLEFEIGFSEPVRGFTFDDIDFTLSTVGQTTGTLTSENATTWTLRITDVETTSGEVVVQVPRGAAMNAANYPSDESTSVTISLNPPVFGDLNGDGLVNDTDRTIMLSLILNPNSVWHTRVFPSQADLNKDTHIDVGDLIVLLNIK